MGPAFEVLDRAWLAGAKAGIAQRERSMSDVEYIEFIESLRVMIECQPEVEPAEPGTAPADGSLYEALGGYVSLAGELQGGCLSFQVPLIRQRRVLALFPGTDVYANRGSVVVPCHELSRFSRLVPVRGPLEERIGGLVSD
jgi:hypothetical protein